MAKKETKMTPRDYEATGPSQSGYEGYGPQGADPSNPSDAIFAGSQLPIIPPQEVVLRRPFMEATRSPLHFSDGPGTDEAVTSRRPIMPPIPGNAHALGDQAELRPLPGTDKNRYASNPNDERTLNGALIYGT